VDDEIIAWEYGLTQKGLGEWRKVIVERMMKGSGGGFPRVVAHDDGGKVDLKRDGMTREQAERLVGSRAKNMLVWMREVLDGELGGERKYLRDYCGLDESDLDKIKENLLEEGKPVELPEDWRSSLEGGMGLAKDQNGAREEKVMIA